MVLLLQPLWVHRAHDRSYASPTFAADRKQIHFGARYNYEDKETGSRWVGYNFSTGDRLALEVTPMIGGVFGNTTGVAPGYKASLAWRRVELSTEGEYVFDTKDHTGNFFYSWMELTYSPIAMGSCWSCSAADQGIPHRPRHPAWTVDRLFTQEDGLHNLRIQCRLD